MSFDVFDVCASGMYAQKTKMDVIASNIANINTTRKDDGSKGVYIKKEVSFKAIYDNKLEDTNAPMIPSGNHKVLYNRPTEEMILKGGISYDKNQISTGVEVAQIEESENPYKRVYDPSHPDADIEGYVVLPNINIVDEMVNMVSASKAYEANATLAETAKNMISSALKI